MIIKNNIIPFGGYKVINLFGLIFTKSDLTDEDKNQRISIQYRFWNVQQRLQYLYLYYLDQNGYGQLFHLSISGMDQSI